MTPLLVLGAITTAVGMLMIQDADRARRTGRAVAVYRRGLRVDVRLLKGEYVKKSAKHAAAMGYFYLVLGIALLLAWLLGRYA